MIDTGPGLSGDGASLFEAYTQDAKGKARVTRNRFDKGTGLGLPIAAQLVRLMGGDIGLENRSDGVRGARFWFWVPYIEAPALPPPPPPAPSASEVCDGADDDPFACRHHREVPVSLFPCVVVMDGAASGSDDSAREATVRTCVFLLWPSATLPDRPRLDVSADLCKLLPTPAT